MGQRPGMDKRMTAFPAVAVLAAGVLAACGGSSIPAAPSAKGASGGPTGSYVVPAGIHKIKHVIVVQQENRSFDSYFGTFPGADGIPVAGGTPTVCVPDPQTNSCLVGLDLTAFTAVSKQDHSTGWLPGTS